MEEEIQEPAPLHGTICGNCKGARNTRGAMRHRLTRYDGEGRADITYVCDKCGLATTQNETDPRTRPDEAVDESSLHASFRPATEEN